MRSQCIVVRGGKILMATHREGGREYHCLPGGGVEPGETPRQAALRELSEECRVYGKIVRKTSEYADPFAGGRAYTFLVDIGEQEPALGFDPECPENPVLAGVGWLRLDEIAERDRAFLWASGLVSVEEYAEELQTWSDDISYPYKKGVR